MKNLFLSFILSFIFLLNANIFSENVYNKNLSIEIGGETIVKIPNLKGLSNPGDGIKEIILDDGESVMFRGLKWGENQVTIWDKSGNKWIYQIMVEMPKYVKDLKNFIGEIEGVDVNFLGNNIIVEGQLLRESDSPKLKGILNNFKEVKNMVNINIANHSDIIIKAVQAELFNYDIKYSFLGEGLMYEGVVLSNDAKNKIKDVGQFYFNSVYPAVNVKKLGIQLELAIMEYVPRDSSNKNNIMLTFLDAYKNNFSGNLISYTFFDAKSNEEILERLSEKGDVVLLEKQMLSVKSGDNISWNSSNNDIKFNIDLSPTLYDLDFVDTRMKFSLEKGGKNLFLKTKRSIIKNKEGMIVLGLIPSIKRLIKDKELLTSLPVISNFFVNDDKKFCFVFITPKWTFKA